MHREVHRLKEDPGLVAVREGAKSLPRLRESPQSFPESSATICSVVKGHFFPVGERLYNTYLSAIIMRDRVGERLV